MGFDLRRFPQMTFHAKRLECVELAPAFEPSRTA